MTRKERITELRTRAGLVYFGLFALVFLGFIGVKMFTFIYTLPEWLWCASWSLFGVAAGLINSRDDDKGKQNDKVGHYVFYFGFVCLIAFISSITIYYSKKIPSYGWSALAAILVGLAGDKLIGRLKVPFNESGG